jgi:alkylation response protein AidB-like acyl-CoA dehydrogenase
MPFFQTPPELANQYESDAMLREYLARLFGPDRVAQLEGEYRELGALAAELHDAFLAELDSEPTLTQWDPWGNRVDRVEVSPLWKRAQVISAERGLVAAAYEDNLGDGLDRVHQFVMNYLVQASMDVYSCPLAMTDGAARTLLDTGNQALIDRAVPRLTSRDPAVMWTSGQWMTERTGGSDVGRSETIAREEDGGWRLYGTKWFTSAVTADMALTLARPEGGGPGGRGLAMFYVELRGDDGRLRGIEVNRLKDKLGTRKVPTAELTLAGTPAIPVAGTSNGTRTITPMLAVTRTWNAVASAWAMRRCLALAGDFAARRIAFGKPLVEKPLHVDTLAEMAAEASAGFLLAFRTAELLGRREQGIASEDELALLRALTPIAKLTTAKQAVAVASETLECFGGAGYIEDTGLPRILADAQVLPIWEGTTNVLSLDLLRALGKGGSFEALAGEVERRLGSVADESLAAAAATARDAFARAQRWIAAAMANPDELERGARRFALTVGRSLELALLCDHAQWCLATGQGPRAAAAARRFAATAIDHIREHDPADARAALGWDSAAE